jgi:hypothetical protein
MSSLVASTLSPILSRSPFLPTLGTLPSSWVSVIVAFLYLGVKQSPGADVIHPAPGSDGRPSYTALVGNVDSDTAKYIATSRVQASRVEIIEDLQDMAKVSGFFRIYCHH